MDEPVKSNRPSGDAFRQQQLAAWQPIMTPWKVIALFVAIGVAFIPTGTKLLSSSNNIYERRITYDGDDAEVNCRISSQNEGKVCQFSFHFNESVSGPLYVYYELDKFYQNHRRYVSSVSYYQLNGESQTESELDTSCIESVKNGSLIINPCGLIANSFFTDIITLNSAASRPNTLSMDEDGITWSTDSKKYSQPSGFKTAAVASTVTSATSATCTAANLPTTCKYYYDSSAAQGYLFYYPDDDTTQYLYETYPQQISPLEGVENEHFQVWMRPAALPQFRKLYGKIEGDFDEGDYLVFSVVANYEVDSFDASKSIVISTVGEFGGRNPYLGIAYIVVGSLSLLFGLLFMAKQLIAPRPYADIALLNWD